jgi:hypothetical protein
MYVDTIAGVIFLIACACVLPIVLALLKTRRKMNEADVRKQIVLAAIEKNKETDVEELLKKMAPKQKLLKEKLLSKLLWGFIFSPLGFVVFCCGLWIDWCGGSDPDEIHFLYICGGVHFAIGLAFIIYYFVGKKVLAKEIEAEEKKLTAEANL